MGWDSVGSTKTLYSARDVELICFARIVDALDDEWALEREKCEKFMRSEVNLGARKTSVRRRRPLTSSPACVCSPPLSKPTSRLSE